jgi:hypothetical protein
MSARKGGAKSGQRPPVGGTIKGGVVSGGRITGKVPKTDLFQTLRLGTSPQKGTIKRSVTFAADIDERAHQLVGERGFSAFVNDATRAALQFAATDRLIAELEGEHGPVTDTELDQARSKLRQARKSRG